MDDDALPLAGPGFADTTRLAASAEALWTDIVRENRDAVLGSLARYTDVLERWAALIRDGAWDALETELGRARTRREKHG